MVYNRRFEMAENTETLDIKQFQLHGKDTGSADVQVALLTRRIAELTEHLKSHAKTILRAEGCSRWSPNAGACSII